VKKKVIFFWGCQGAALLIAFMLLYGVWIEPNRVEIHHVWIQDNRLEQLLKDKVVVQLSDLHMRTFGTREHNVLKMLNSLRPDIIFLTGDYVAWKGDYEVALNFLSQLHAKIGIWAVMGDYDYSNTRKSCLFCHEEGSGNPTRRHSVHFLRNNIDIINLPDGSVSIAGITDEDGSAINLKGTSLGRSGKVPTIILSHSPLSFELFSDNQNLLMLAGDTHGGQVPLPVWAFSIVGYKKNALYSQGLFKRGNRKMFVSRGIGTSHVPIRLFRRPEIVVLHFTK
jgi:predicted MPP superfamily phosphohydrolase